ncbi:hypothetical protein AB4Z21_26605 [Paenibacillus sp. MCAF20]
MIVQDQSLNGAAINSKKITLSDSLVNLYSTHQHVVHYMLAHEFIHLIHKEYGTLKNAFIRVGGYVLGNRYLQAIVLLQEIRAAIDENKLANLTPKQIQSAQIKLHIKINASRYFITNMAIRVEFKSSGFQININHLALLQLTRFSKIILM